ncbi:MAG: hypothetical protein ACRDGE_02225 [Candidatus Limnocylindria bacterium]
MAEVVTIVRGLIQPDRVHEVADPYAEALKDGPPPDLEETFLLKGNGQLAILSVWHRRADLDAMLASGEEPFARRLIRAAGGTPEVLIYEVVARARTGEAS